MFKYETKNLLKIECCSNNMKNIKPKLIRLFKEGYCTHQIVRMLIV